MQIIGAGETSGSTLFGVAAVITAFGGLVGTVYAAFRSERDRDHIAEIVEETLRRADYEGPERRARQTRTRQRRRADDE